MAASIRELPPHRRFYLAIISLSVVVSGVVFALPDAFPKLEDAPALFLLMLLVAGGVAVPVEIGPKTKIGVGITAMFATLLLYGTSAAIVVTALGVLVAYIVRPGRNSNLSRAFNIAVLVLAMAAGGGVAYLISGSLVPMLVSNGREIIAIVAAAGVVYLINTVLVAIAADLQLGQPLLSYYVEDQRAKLPQYMALFLLGALAALVAVGRPWAVLLVALPMAIVAISFRQTAQLRRQATEAIEQLADIVDLRDPYTAEHSRRVAKYSQDLCHELNLNRWQTDIIVRAARVHDIGKLGMSNAIVTEARRLTDEEMAEMRRHPEIGANIVSRFSDFRAGTAIVLHHHERWDGKGYPTGLAGEAIPYGARVVAVCDTFDAMTSDRPYRKALSVDVALGEIERCSGTQFDPDVAQAFLRVSGYKSQAIPEGNLGTVTQ